jgi:hypothetical protein
MLVAENQIEYEDFDEGARRADEEMIYAWLERDDSARLINPILDSFYIHRYSQIVGNINRLETEITLLSDSILISDSVAWHSQLQLVKTMNNLLGVQQIFEANSKWINEKYLSVLENGVEAIDIESWDDIETLANTCTLIGGNAVYRARTLFGFANAGIHYDDLVLCNGQGVYKNGISKLQEQLNSINGNTNSKKLIENGVSIYPNPVSKILCIEYDFEKDATLIIYDVLGNKLIKQNLLAELNKDHIDVTMISAGIYYYEVLETSGTKFFGKVIIE